MQPFLAKYGALLTNTYVPQAPDAPRRISVFEMEARPYSARVEQGRLPSRGCIGFFGIRLSNYSIWEDGYKEDEIPYVCSNGIDVYALDHMGFAVYEGIKGMIVGRGLVYCTALIMHDESSGISIDSHLPIDHRDLGVFEEDFSSLMTYLKSRGLDPHATSAHVLYGVENEPRNYLLEGAGVHVAQLIMRHGIAVCGLYPIFKSAAKYNVALDCSHVDINY